MSTSEIFTPLAKSVLSESAQEALLWHHTSVEPEHLLLTLLRAHKGGACRVLDALNVAPVYLRERLCKVMTMGNGEVVEEELQLSERSKWVIECAVDVATSLQHDTLTTAHLLMGIMLEDGVAAEQMRMRRVTVEALQRVIGSNARIRDEATSVESSSRDESEQEKILKRYQPFISLFMIIFLACFVLFIIVLVNNYPIWQIIANILPAFNGFLLSIPFINIQPIHNWYPLIIIIYFSLCTSCVLMFTPVYCFVRVFLPNYYRAKTKTFRQWLAVKWKRFLINYFFAVLYLEAGIFFFFATPQNWWISLSTFYVLVALCRIYLWPVCYDPLFYKVTPITDSALLQQLAVLTKRSQTHIRGFYLLDRLSSQSDEDIIANAYLKGLGVTRRIALTSTLVKNFPPDEIEVILAHELGHHVHYDLWKQLALGAILQYSIFYVLYLFFKSFVYQENLVAPMSLVYPLDFCNLFLLYLFLSEGAFYVKRWYSRWRERQADEYALFLTQNVSAFKSEQVRMARINKYPASPRFYYRLRSTHPTTKERLRHADDFARRMAQKNETV